MRWDRQMFPPRQLLRSAFGRSERRGCIWFTEGKERKGEKREEKKKDGKLHCVSCISSYSLCCRVFEGMPSHVEMVHPHPTRMNATLISLDLIESLITRTRHTYVWNWNLSRFHDNRVRRQCFRLNKIQNDRTSINKKTIKNKNIKLLFEVWDNITKYIKWYDVAILLLIISFVWIVKRYIYIYIYCLIYIYIYILHASETSWLSHSTL